MRFPWFLTVVALILFAGVVAAGSVEYHQKSANVLNGNGSSAAIVQFMDGYDADAGGRPLYTPICLPGVTYSDGSLLCRQTYLVNSKNGIKELGREWQTEYRQEKGVLKESQLWAGYNQTYVETLNRVECAVTPYSVMEANGTQTTKYQELCQPKTYSTTRWRINWIPASNGLKFEQDTPILLQYRGKLAPESRIDVIPVVDGKRLEKWAWWNASYASKREVNLTVTGNATETGFTFWGNFSYVSGMDDNFDGVAFVNGTETTLLDFCILENHSKQSFMAVVKTDQVIPVSPANTTVYMYYNSAQLSLQDCDKAADKGYISKWYMAGKTLNATQWSFTNTSGANGVGVYGGNLNIVSLAGVINGVQTTVGWANNTMGAASCTTNDSLNVGNDNVIGYLANSNPGPFAGADKKALFYNASNGPVWHLGTSDGTNSYGVAKFTWSTANYSILRVARNSTSNVSFWLNETQVYTTATNIPSPAVTWSIRSQGAAAGGRYIQCRWAAVGLDYQYPYPTFLVGGEVNATSSSLSWSNPTPANGSYVNASYALLNASTTGVVLGGDLGFLTYTNSTGTFTALMTTNTSGFFTFNLTNNVGVVYYNATASISGANASSTALQLIMPYLHILSLNESDANTVNSNKSFNNGTSSASSLNTLYTEYFWNNTPTGTSTVQVSASGFASRSTSVTIGSTYQSVTVLLSASASTAFYTFQVQTSSGSIVSDATITVSKNVGGTVYNVSSSACDASGVCVFALITGDVYTVSVVSPTYGYGSITYTAAVTPRVIIIGGTASQPGYSSPLNGLQYWLQPDGSLYNGTSYTFNYTLAATIAYKINYSAYSFCLFFPNHTIMGCANGTTYNGGTVSLTRNVGSGTLVYAVLNFTASNDGSPVFYNATRFWFITQTPFGAASGSHTSMTEAIRGIGNAFGSNQGGWLLMLMLGLLASALVGSAIGLGLAGTTAFAFMILGIIVLSLGMGLAVTILFGFGLMVALAAIFYFRG